MLYIARLVLRDLLHCWRRLLIIDLVYKVVAFVALWPLAGLVLHGFIASAGTSALADQDIILFVLSPIGLAAVIVVLALCLGVFALEQTCLLIVCKGELDREHIDPVPALWCGSKYAVPVLRLSLRAVAYLLVVSAPFLAGMGLTYWYFLTEFDI